MSGLDITPAVPAGRQVVQAYGDGGFRISGQAHRGSVVVFPDRTTAWAVTSAEAITADALTAAMADASPVDILLVGCGRRFQPPPKGLIGELRQRGVAVEWMDTGAACRTYNVLLGEDRRVAAALIAVE